MRAAGRSYTYILLLWNAIAIGAAVSIAAGYVAFASLSEAWPPRLQAFGAGALLAMIAETMIPEAFHNSPRFSGLLAAFGFGLLLLVDVMTHSEETACSYRSGRERSEANRLGSTGLVRWASNPASFARRRSCSVP
jgi:hypothetical protein